MLRFSTLLLDAEDEGKKLTEFPSEYYDLVVLAGHELYVNLIAVKLR